MEIPELLALLQAKIKTKFDTIQSEESKIAMARSELNNQLRTLEQLLKEITISKD